ncbi:MAG: helix-turn-helix domain-containing protein [Dysgonamonadaceae bacterium]|jgi:transcriptional regulator with XRE-family HTH domain|nr:helix-turn-helix domain-containing protein [Dysgonamonadaceae bacterium]
MKLRIADILREKKLTQKELAAQIKMSEVGLSQRLNGNPTKNTLEKIAAALDVTVTELFEQPAKYEISCPHCGKPIKVSAG